MELVEDGRKFREYSAQPHLFDSDEIRFGYLKTAFLFNFKELKKEWATHKQKLEYCIELYKAYQNYAPR